jgi:hypothetical protein
MAIPKGISFLIPGFEQPITGSYNFEMNNGIKGMQFSFEKYFEYDDGKGNPIYDEESGEKLRDPITGEPAA